MQRSRLVYRRAMSPTLSVSAWRLAARQTWRDLRAGDLRLLMLAVTLAVAALSAVGFFADRLESGLSRDARKLLGGDAVLVSDKPAPPEFAVQAGSEKLRVATSATFPSMARAAEERGGATRLVAVKAVSDTYPLRGKLRVKDAADARERDVVQAAARGSVWVDAPVLDSLNLRVGDALLLGDARLTIARIIVLEPDRGAGFINFAPRVLLNEADLAATGLVQPASRVTYRLAVAVQSTDEAAVNLMRSFLILYRMDVGADTVGVQNHFTAAAKDHLVRRDDDWLRRVSQTHDRRLKVAADQIELFPVFVLRFHQHQHQVRAD